ncbi:MAG: right-handed parallel beta-helix repeat-containing protein, partial [Phycisphaerales bacterium]|nr:right-handed parallel beta-helix repeat-containing protein [Phycisphaerales bacterium]
SADTIHVPADYSLIQDAIDAASNGDVIEIAAGTYAENDISTDGKAITILGAMNKDGTPATMIDGQGIGKQLSCTNGETESTRFENLIIADGWGTLGGAMYISNSSPTLVNCTFIDNVSNNVGGGIYCNGSSPTLENCTFIDNVSNDNGGGIYCFNNSSPTLVDCTFRNNTSENGYGGGFSGAGTFTNCSFTNNTADYGGGIAGGSTFTDCSFTGNTADYGGGIYSESTSTLKGCAIENNASERGGGISVGSGSLFMLGTVVRNNDAVEGGGAHLGSPDSSISGGLFEFNGAEFGGGIWAWNNATISGAIVQNNIASINGGGIYSEYDNYCMVVASTVCSNSPNQVWHIEGDDTNEINESCSANAAACCVNGSCILLDEITCGNVGGNWSGSGTPCGDYQCPEPCLGDVNGDDQVNVADLLTVIANWNSCP